MERRRPAATGFVFHDPDVPLLPRPAPAMETAGSATSSPCCTTPAARTRRPGSAAAGAATHKRSRVEAFGSTEEYEEMSCRLGEGGFGGGGGPEELLREARLHVACGAHPFIVGLRGVVRDPATAALGLGRRRRLAAPPSASSSSSLFPTSRSHSTTAALLADEGGAGRWAGADPAPTAGRAPPLGAVCPPPDPFTEVDFINSMHRSRAATVGAALDRAGGGDAGGEAAAREASSRGPRHRADSGSSELPHA